MAQGFVTHRCGKMPDGFSLRKYDQTCEEIVILPETGFWVLGKHKIDFEWDYEYLDAVTPFASQAVHYCPWCGKRLE